MLTDFYTPENNVCKNYRSRGRLILECVKINDLTINDEDKKFESVEAFEALALHSGNTYKGFNIVFGNVHKQAFKYA